MPNFFLGVGLIVFFLQHFFLILSPPPPPPPTHMNSAVFLNIGLTQTCIANDVPPFSLHGNLPKAPRGRQGNAKLIVRNNVKLKLRLRNMKKWVSKWLEMHSRDIFFPRRCLRCWFKPLLSVPPTRQQLLWVQAFFVHIFRCI